MDTTGTINARRRGFVRVVVTAATAADTAWVHGIQVVRSIVAQPETLLFHALGQTELLHASLIDDQGHEVVDSLPDVGVAVTTAMGLQAGVPVPSVVDVQAGKPLALRSVSEGSVELTLRAGTIARRVAVLVNQRVASVRLTSRGINTDALRDTIRLAVQLSDSLGAPVAGQTVTYRSSDTTVASVAADGLVTPRGNGSAWVHARASNGMADSVPVTVSQRVARVVVVPDSLAFDALQAGRSGDELDAYNAAFQDSWLFDELYRARNFKQWMSKGLYSGTLMVGVEQTLLGGKFPWTLHHRHADHECLRPASECEPIDYPKPDGKLTFDRLSSVFISNTNHEENQPCHLVLKDATVPVGLNLAKYAGPESRYCPAGVYEFVKDGGGTDRLQINAQNCVHCKTCDIKDPTQNIVWVTPQGGGGPNYPDM